MRLTHAVATFTAAVAAVAGIAGSAAQAAGSPKLVPGVARCNGASYFDVSVYSDLPPGTSEDAGNQTERQYRIRKPGTVKILGKSYTLRLSGGTGYVETQYDRTTKKTEAVSVSWTFRHVKASKKALKQAKNKPATLRYHTHAGTLTLHEKRIYAGPCAG